MAAAGAAATGAAAGAGTAAGADAGAGTGAGGETAATVAGAGTSASRNTPAGKTRKPETGSVSGADEPGGAATEDAASEVPGGATTGTPPVEEEAGATTDADEGLPAGKAAAGTKAPSRPWPGNKVRPEANTMRPLARRQQGIGVRSSIEQQD